MGVDEWEISDDARGYVNCRTFPSGNTNTRFHPNVTYKYFQTIFLWREKLMEKWQTRLDELVDEHGETVNSSDYKEVELIKEFLGLRHLEARRMTPSHDRSVLPWWDQKKKYVKDRVVDYIKTEDGKHKMVLVTKDEFTKKYGKDKS